MTALRLRPVLLFASTVLACSAGITPLQSPEEPQAQVVARGVTASDYAAHLDVLALGYADGTFEVRSPAPHHLLSRGKHAAPITNLALSKDGQYVATLDELGTLAVSAVQSGDLGVLADQDRELVASGTGALVGLAWDGAGKRLAVCAGSLVRVVELQGEAKHEARLGEAATAVAFSLDGNELVAAGKRLHFLSLPELRSRKTIDVPAGQRPVTITDVRFDPDGQLLGVLMLGGVAFLDRASGRLDVAHFRQLDPVGLRFGRDGKVAIFGRRALYVGAPVTTDIERGAQATRGDVSDVEFREDGSLMFVGDAQDAELATLLQ